MKNHFRAHQLSVWLRLIPELHRAGMEDVVARHNLFRNHNDHDLYDGVVRPDPLSRTNYGLYYNSDRNQDFVYGNGGVSFPFSLAPSILRASFKSIFINFLFLSFQVLANTGRRHHHGRNESYGGQVVTTPETLLTTCVSVINSYPSVTHHLGHQNNTDPLANLEAAGKFPTKFIDPNRLLVEQIYDRLMIAGYAAYSTALSVTIAIGCSLLILNVLIFAGVYYQRDKTRMEVKSLQQSQRGSVNYDVKPGHYDIGEFPHEYFVSNERENKFEIISSASGGSIIVDLEQDTANMILCQNQQLDGGNILLCQSRFASTATLPRTGSGHCAQSAEGGGGTGSSGGSGGGGGGAGVVTSTMTIKKPTPDISRNNLDLGIRTQDCRNPDILKNNPSVNSAGETDELLFKI